MLTHSFSFRVEMIQVNNQGLIKKCIRDSRGHVLIRNILNSDVFTSFCYKHSFLAYKMMVVLSSIS